MEILLCDPNLVVVHKPAGLLVHRTAIASQAEEFAVQRVRDLIGAHVYPVHRLDRPTSGVLVFARSPQDAKALSEQFSSGRVHKRYLAIVRGIPAAEEHLIDYPLLEELDRKTDKRARLDKPPQQARTKVRRLAQVELPIAVDRYPTSRYALIEACPQTGRKHQIRRHLRHIGHPIIGDVTHGSGKHNRFFAARFGVRRLFLACTSLSFVHPGTGEELTVKAPLAPEFHSVGFDLGWGAHLEP